MTVRLLLIALSGVAYGAIFPTLRWRALAWIALVPLLLAVRGTPLRRAVALGFVWGTIAACVTADWMPGAIVRYWDQPWLAGLGVLLGGAVATSSIFYMLFTGWYALVTRAGVRATLPLLAAAAWVATELARTEVLIGNPWGLLGYSQIGVLPLMQIADVAGVYGMSFPIVAVNAALVELVVAWRQRRSSSRREAPPLRRAGIGAASALAAVLLVLGYGVARLVWPPSIPAGPRGDVLLVQGNLDLGSQWREESFGANLDAYLTMTRDGLRATPAALVVWPENAMSFFVEDEPAFRAAIAAVLGPARAELLAGGPRKVRAARDETRFLNAAFLLEPGGDVRACYEKRALVPFAESFPLAGAETLRRRFGRVREFTPGSATPPLPTVLGPAGVLICNEAMFPGLARARVAAGSGWLVNLTNDSWVGDEKYAVMVSEMERLRAVEQRRFLVRSSTGGPSLVVDPLGRVVAEVPFGARATLTAGVVAGGQRTLYARIGDSFAIACAVAALAAAFVAWRRNTCDDGRAAAGSSDPT